MSGSKSNTDPAKRDWVKRVLGLDAGPAKGGSPLQQVLAARAVWEDAIGIVDAQIGDLQKLLRSSRDDELKAIAEFGLPGVTGGHKVRLTAALMEAKAGTLSPKAAGKAAAVVDSFRKHIANDPRVEACEKNPGRVKVAIRATLDGPLAQLGEALRAVEAA